MKRWSKTSQAKRHISSGTVIKTVAPPLSSLWRGLAVYALLGVLFACTVLFPSWVMPEMRQLVPLPQALAAWAILVALCAGVFLVVWWLQLSRFWLFAMTPTVVGYALHFAVIHRIDRSWRMLDYWLGFVAVTAEQGDRKTAFSRRLRAAILPTAIIFASLLYWVMV